MNVKNGDFVVRDKHVPPAFDGMKSLVEQKLESRGKLFDFSKLPMSIKAKAAGNTNSAAHMYAVIISGGADTYNNWERYWNDCSAIYSALINVYGYQKDHIYVLMSDGTDPSDDRHLNNGSYESSPLIWMGME